MTDEAARYVLTAVQLPEDSVTRWFELLVEAHATVARDGRTATEIVNEMSGSWSTSTDIDALREALTSLGTEAMPAVETLVREADSLPQQYRDALTTAMPETADDQAVEEPASVTTLAWVTETQQATILPFVAPEDNWQDFLRGALGEWWPQWTEATPEQLGPWLDQALPSLGAAPATTATEQAPVTALTWVTEAHIATISPFVAPEDNWQDFLRGTLDGWWPQWTEATPEQLGPWLDGALPALGPAPAQVTTAAESAPAAEPAVTDLAWVTTAQRTQLDELYEIRGDWPQWLPEELDAVDDGWRDRSATDLTARLDAMLPGLLLPPEDALHVEEVSDAVLTVIEERPDLADFVRNLDETAFTELLTRASATAH